MAQLILSAAGGAISTYMGFGPAAGWAIGSMLGAATIKNPTQKVQGDQQTIMDLRITGTEYGRSIPFLIGSASIAGQMWWNTDRRPNTVTTTTHTGGGGKGGGGGGTDVTSSTTTYDMDCLIGLTDNPIIGISRVWINGELIWTSDHDATDASRAASLVSTSWARLTVYNGSDTQLPDPTYEAAVGIGNAPAYRGRSYVFIEGLKLGQGGQVPNVTFEVVAAGHALVAGTFASYGRCAGQYMSSNMYYCDIG